MHEASIAYSLLEMLEETARKERADKVVKAVVKVGALSGVVVDSLIFAFEAMKDTFPSTTHAELVVEEVPLSYRCLECQLEFTRDDPFFPSCPSCGGVLLEQIGGEELDLERVEMEENHV